MMRGRVAETLASVPTWSIMKSALSRCGAPFGWEYLAGRTQSLAVFANNHLKLTSFFIVHSRLALIKLLLPLRQLNLMKRVVVGC